MNVDGRIVVTRRESALGRYAEAYSYAWEGGPLAAVDSYRRAEGVDTTHWRLGRRVVIGPYRVRVVAAPDAYSFSLYCQSFIVSREPGWRSLLRAWLWRCSGPANLAYRRSILTLAVWRLADYAQGAYLSWRDIKVVKRLSAWWRS